MSETHESFPDTLIEVGKIFIDRQGAGRLYIPRKVVKHLGLENKDHMKLEADTINMKATAIKKL